MLTAFNIHSNKAFQYLINKFVKKNGIIADITYANGLAWKDFDNKKNFTIIKSDKRKTQEDVKQQTIKKFFEQTKEKSLDGIYFDPPHYFKDRVGELNHEDKDLNDVNEVYTTKAEFEEMVTLVGKNAYNLLREKGILIIKMIDGYVGTKFFPNTFNTFNKIEELEPMGHFISVLSRKSGLPTLVQINHVSFLVFKKINQEQKENGK